jgi:hypothetical protein
MERALFKQRGMPTEFGGVVVTAIYLLNRLLTKSLTRLTPYEAWHGTKSAVHHLRVFGCRAYVKELGHVSKLMDRSNAADFIRYVEGVKPYRALRNRCHRAMGLLPHPSSLHCLQRLWPLHHRL